MKSRAGVEGCYSPPSEGECKVPRLKLLGQSENDMLLLILFDSDHDMMGNLCWSSLDGFRTSC